MKVINCKLSFYIIALLAVIICMSVAACGDIQADPSVAETPTSSSSPTMATDPQPTDSTPTQPTDPPPTEPDPNALTEDEIAQLQNIYQLNLSESGHLVTNFYNSALGIEYDDPRDISLGYFFREGDQEEFSMSDTEFEFIKSSDPNAEAYDWYRISMQDVERILKMCFGLSLSDMNSDDLDLQLLYWEDTNCYYSGTTSPAPRANDLEITGGTHLEDGNLKVFYTANSETQYVMILKPVDGGYLILSNLKAEG